MTAASLVPLNNIIGSGVSCYTETESYTKERDKYLPVVIRFRVQLSSSICSPFEL